MSGAYNTLVNVQQALKNTLRGPVAVLLGGKASERAVSLNSGNAVLAALKSIGVDAHALDTQDEEWINRVRAYPHAFIALHGVGGEDGVAQAILEELNITYTGSAVLASALGMDKLRTKQIWQGVGLPTPSFEQLNAASDWAAIMQKFGVAMVKPAHEGSSIGMARVTTADELKAAYSDAAQYDTSVIAEQWITGAEFTVAILDGDALPPIRLETTHSFYDYDAKYLANDTRYVCPCGLSTEKEAALKKLAVSAFQAVGCRDWGRVDVMQNAAGDFFLLEVNTVPGMTDHSLVPMAAKEAGLNFEHLVATLLLLSISRSASGEAK